MKNPAAVALGRLGGKATSEAKARAVRENAKLGGWPKGKPRKPKKRVTRESTPKFETIICLICGKTFSARPCKKRKTCSRKCSGYTKVADPQKNADRVKKYLASPKTKRLTETNCNAKRWHLRSPMNVEYHPVNLNLFVAEHRHLFDPYHLELCHDGISTRAAASLASLRPSNKKKRQPVSWKGWTWISIIEKRFNDGRDLLERHNDPHKPCGD